MHSIEAVAIRISHLQTGDLLVRSLGVFPRGAISLSKGHLMTPQNKLIESIAEYSSIIRDASCIKPFGQQVHAENALADATKKFEVDLLNGQSGFLIVSGDGNPDLVARAARNIRDIRGRLSTRVAEPIVEPLEMGAAMGYSFAIWPHLRRFPDLRFAQFVAKRWIEPKVMQWLCEIFRESHTSSYSGNEGCAAGHLLCLIDNFRLPDEVRRAAEDASNGLIKKKWEPIRCAQHSDFWFGNILLGGKASGAQFSVIDWAGAQTSGYPFFDLCRFALSFNTSQSHVRKAADQYFELMQGEAKVILPYVLCSLGQLLSSSEHFPATLFQKMAVEVIDFADSLDRIRT